jgi:hypothetical protein
MTPVRVVAGAVLAAVAVSLGACAETPGLPPDSPENPASTAAAEATVLAGTVLAQALPPPGGTVTGIARPPAVDHSHHHHGGDAGDAGSGAGEGKP